MVNTDSKGICQVEGVKYPAVGFGTYPLKGTVCHDAVTKAVSLGYHIIDTATYYENFEPIGEALQQFDRHQLYLISKVWPFSQDAEGIAKDIKSTLQKLKTPYLDAYLLHWPNSHIPIEITLEAMNQLIKQGLIRHIGLSNVTVNHLKRALEVGIPITWVQNEMHAFFYEPKLLDFCREHDIVFQAWRPLDLGRISQDPLLNELGGKYQKTACQIALRWIIQHGCVPLPGSKTESHIKENLDAVHFNINSEDMAKMNQRASQGKRFRLTMGYGVGFEDEFDFSYEECWPKAELKR